MANLLDHLEAAYAGKYVAERTEIQHGNRLSLSHLDQVVTIDLFKSGKFVVGGTRCELKAEVENHSQEFRKDPKYFDRLKERQIDAPALTPEQAINKKLTREAFEFLPEHDRRALVASYEILLSGLNLVDYSPITMPVGRVYEGFLVEMLIRTGICSRILLQDPTYQLMSAFDSREAKVFHAKVSTHQAKLDSAKQRLKEFRHIQLHSQSSQFVQSRTREEASNFVERVLGDMQGLFDYFKKYFV